MIEGGNEKTLWQACMTIEDIKKVAAEIEERWQGKFIDSQTFADLKDKINVDSQR